MSNLLQSEIRKAYRKQAMIYHPDKNKVRCGQGHILEYPMGKC